MEFIQVNNKNSRIPFLPWATHSFSTPPILKMGHVVFLAICFTKTALCHVHFTWGAGEYAPMPPVFGPRSPSIRRLWSWAGGMGATVTPSVKHKHYTWKSGDKSCDFDRAITNNIREITLAYSIMNRIHKLLIKKYTLLYLFHLFFKDVYPTLWLTWALRVTNKSKCQNRIQKSQN